jgi:hypothetical protein
LVGKPEENKLLKRHKNKREYDILMGLKEILWELVD